MLFRHLDAAAATNARNGLFGADGVLIGGTGGLQGSGYPGSEPCRPHEPMPAADRFSGPVSPAKRPATPRRGPAAPATPVTAKAAPARATAAAKTAAPAGRSLWGLAGDPGARVWASWVVSRAVSA